LAQKEQLEERKIGSPRFNKTVSGNEAYGLKKRGLDPNDLDDLKVQMNLIDFGRTAAVSEFGPS